MDTKYIFSKNDIMAMLTIIKELDNIMGLHLSSQLKRDLLNELFRCSGNYASNLYKEITSIRNIQIGSITIE